MLFRKRTRIMLKNKDTVLQNNQLASFMFRFGALYLLAFYLLEKRNSKIYIIHTALDDMIPYCKYFVIPYLFWFIFMGAALYYFLFVSRNKRENEAVIYSAVFGMILFTATSLVFPNGHNLRPDYTGDGFFGRCVEFVYSIDTPTNILPSLHVFLTVVATIGFMHRKELRSKKGFSTAIIVTAILIILSTMFLKQHSIVDVISALLLNLICYSIFYKPDIKEKKRCIRKKYLQSQTY